MSEGKERITAEHPKAWVVRMVDGRGIRVPEKTLYWWSVYLERLLRFCRSAGVESSEVPEVAARLFVESLPVGGCAGGGADGVGCFYKGDGGVVVGGGSGWAGGAEIPVEGEFGRMDHRGGGEHGGGWVRKSRGGPG